LFWFIKKLIAHLKAIQLDAVMRKVIEALAPLAELLDKYLLMYDMFKTARKQKTLHQ
jgi:hypothetical protein